MSFVLGAFTIIGAVGTLFVFLVLSLIVADGVVAWQRERRMPQPTLDRGRVEQPSVYCERCELKTAAKCEFLSSVVVICRDDACGFSRILRNDDFPEQVGVIYDPGPTHPQEEEPWNHRQ